MSKTIYTHPTEVKEASIYIYNNMTKCYITTIRDNSYYNINGVVWEIWQSGTGNYPTTKGTLVNNFKP
jgi:hypothetical protein